MRKAFINSLIELAEKDKDIFLLTGDLGFSVLESFAEKFPDRFINCGVAEQNMMGVAAGLALSGKKPYVYSITPFVTLRCFEQIKNDVCYQNVNVKLIGIGAGFDYGHLGSTHYAIEEIAALRVLPNMKIFAPADPREASELLIQSYHEKGPCYFRIGKQNQILNNTEESEIKIGYPRILKEGGDGAIFTFGPQALSCLQIAEELESKGKSFKVVNFHTIKPINKEKLFKAIENIEKVFVIEEHNVIGGLGGAVAEILAESNWKGNFKIIGVPDKYPKVIGNPEFLRRLFSIDKESVIKRILEE